MSLLTRSIATGTGFNSLLEKSQESFCHFSQWFIVFHSLH
jgi:hypothetical protein